MWPHSRWKGEQEQASLYLVTDPDLLKMTLMRRAVVALLGMALWGSSGCTESSTADLAETRLAFVQ